MFRELIYRYMQIRPEDLEGLPEDELQEALKDKAEIDAALDPMYEALAPFKTRQFWRTRGKEWLAVPLMFCALLVSFLRNRHHDFAADVFVMVGRLQETSRADMGEREKLIDTVIERLSAHLWGKV